PRSTLKSCGSSSIEVRRISLPTPVRRSVPSTPPGAVSPGSSTDTLSGGGSSASRIDRNLSRSKSRPSRPTRRWRKKIGPRDETRIRAARGEEGEDDVLGAGRADDLGQLVGPAEHGHVTARDLVVARRMGVDVADRPQPELGLLVEAALDLGTDAAGAHDQRAL